MGRKKKGQVTYKQQVENKIAELKQLVQEREELFKYYKSTMKHFRRPELRVKGIDMIQFELDYPIVKQELKRYEQIHSQLI